MPIAPATRLGPYEIVAPLGAGGMGEVYRARDTRLGRDVAIKVLPEHLMENAEVRARFEREARTISSLNHPNICTLFDVGRAPVEGGTGETDFLVMELVEGETLADRIARGPLPQHEVLRLATQIADALDRAHRAGIVHRDFKPGNVMVTKSGAKLMDFGLARNVVAPGMSPGSGSTGVTIAQLTQSPTVASPLTQQGSLIGTFLYMAPEQLEGREVDARCDIWAFGCVLYEMLTGRRAFEGKSQASLVGSIMNSEPPPLSTSSPNASPALDALIRACIAKDPEERIQTAHDIKLQLSWLAQSGMHSGTTGPIELPKPRRTLEPVAWGVAGVAVLAAAFFGWRSFSIKPPPQPQIRFEIPIPASIIEADIPTISPDGKLLAFTAQDSAARQMVWIRPLNSLTANPLAGTENVRRPFWSPDSRYLAFIADGKLKKIAVSGGPAEVICTAPSGSDGTWGRDGTILYDGAGADPIMRVSSSGGVAVPEVKPDSTNQVGWPAFLPDGKHYFYSVLKASGSEIMLGELGKPTGRSLGSVGSRVAYSPDGYLLFARDRALLAQRFDVGALKLIGDPVPIAEDLPVAGNAQANFTVSSTGVLVYRATGQALSRLVWLGRDGRELEQLSGPADYRAPALSPDGRRVALRRRDGVGGNLDLWILDLVRGTSTRFTFDPGDDGNPVWSPDGQTIAWNGNRGTKSLLLSKSSSGLGEEKTLYEAQTSATPTFWSQDGKNLFFQELSPNTRWDLKLVPVTGDGEARALVNTPFAEFSPMLSPNGRWLAYESDESGRSEVYVVSFDGPAGKWQVSTRGGYDPIWSHDGRELYYLTDDLKMMVVPIAPGETFTPGTPQQMFSVRFETGTRRNVYCVGPDDKKFLFLVPVGESSTPITAVVNWQAALARR